MANMKRLFLIIIIISFFSCTSNTIYKKPQDLIPRDTIVSLLTDLYIAGASRDLKNSYFQAKVDYIPLIYNKYKIDSSRFKRSNFYYTTRLDEYQKLLEQVKRNLENYKKKYVDERRIKDSIRRDSIKKLAPKTTIEAPNKTYKKGSGDLLNKRPLQN
ncbi:MAG: DUF4296 domain-containing protein [Flavobacteriaceae bacterium]|nr:MAG: DUF4296 domain-containing protein [Flavobacteriaceae bacterium]